MLFPSQMAPHQCAEIGLVLVYKALLSREISITALLLTLKLVSLSLCQYFHLSVYNN